MKHLKFTKTNLTQLPHPTGKTPDRIFVYFLINFIDFFKSSKLKCDIFNLNKLILFFANFKNSLLRDLGPSVQIIFIFFWLIIRLLYYFIFSINFLNIIFF